MIEGKTKTGFEFSIDENVMDDWDFFSDVTDLSEGNAVKIVPILKKLLGNEQLNSLKEHCRTESGKVPLSAMVAEYSEIMNSSTDTKNS